MPQEGRYSQRDRLHVLTAIFAGVFIVLLARLLNLQIVNYEAYRDLAEASHLRETSIPPRRGSLLDTNLRPLAISVEFDDVSVVGKEIKLKDREGTARALAQVLELRQEDILAKISPENDRPVLIKARLPSALAARVEALDLDGVVLQKRPYRKYPEGSIAPQVLGFIGQDREGLSGLEYSFDEELTGTPGKLLSERDTINREISLGRRLVVEPVHGADLVLTIDRVIQRVAEQTLTEAVAANKASGGLILIMEPTSGSILAMTSLPSYFLTDELDYRAENEAVYKSVLVTNQYEPGSVMKPITMAAGLDQGLVTPQSVVNDQGWIEVGGYTLKNWDGRANGIISMTDVLIKSSNIGAQYVAGKLGGERFYRYVEQFGFGKRSGVRLPGEVPGTLRLPIDPGWARVDLATNAYGQGIAVTPLQMLTAISAIANNGMLMQPRIVREIRRGDQVTQVEPRPVRQVISPATAGVLTDMMVKVLEQPDLLPHRLPGYRFAGKTGTADTPTNLGYNTSKTYASVVAFGPLPNLRYSILIRLDAPEAIFGGIVAAPVLKRLNQELLNHYRIPPTPAPAPTPGRPAP